MVVGVCIITIGIIYLLYLFFEDGNHKLVFATIPFMIAGIIVSVCDIQYPKAMDVYQGKTTLRITYENGIPVDSVVIYKRK